MAKSAMKTPSLLQELMGKANEFLNVEDDLQALFALLKVDKKKVDREAQRASKKRSSTKASQAHTNRRLDD